MRLSRASQAESSGHWLSEGAVWLGVVVQREKHKVPSEAFLDDELRKGEKRYNNSSAVVIIEGWPMTENDHEINRGMQWIRERFAEVLGLTPEALEWEEHSAGALLQVPCR